MDKYFYATQYYRYPTPLESEWDYDIKNLGKYNLDVFQIRINWRANELREDEYNFDDVDKLMQLAKENNKKVVIKFLLECAPQYIFNKYGAIRVGIDGRKLMPAYHGAFYGGWLPCYTNKKVRERAAKFVKTVVERYKNYDNIVLYNAWNEIRNRPIEECFCEHCRKEYADYLKDKYKTIENLNKFYGASEESFDEISLPSSPHGVWDTYEYFKFRGEYVNAQKVKMVYDAIREVDKTTKIICHVGFSCSYQDNIKDCVNDFYVSDYVDGFGTSIPFEHHMQTFNDRCDLQLLNDFLRCVDENYFVYEVYPSLGMYRIYDTEFDMRYKLIKILSCGAKGICFWQYRSERVGHEADCAGLCYMNGEKRPVLDVVKQVGDFIKDNNDFLVNGKKKLSKVGILYDFDSMMISEIEDCFGPDFSFDQYNPVRYYFKAHQGLYRLLTRANYAVDYISTSNFDDLNNYKVIFVPYLAMLNENISKKLESFVAQGGTLVLDEGFGLRNSNTWAEPYNIKVDFMSSWLEFRIRETQMMNYKGTQIPVGPYCSNYIIDGADTVCNFENGSPAIQLTNFKGGKVYSLGFSLGYGAYETQPQSYVNIVQDILQGANIETLEYADAENEIEENSLFVDDKRMIFLFNNSDSKKTIPIKEKIIKNCSNSELQNNNLTLYPKTCGILIVESL